MYEPTASAPTVIPTANRAAATNIQAVGRARRCVEANTCRRSAGLVAIGPIPASRDWSALSSASSAPQATQPTRCASNAACSSRSSQPSIDRAARVANG